MPVYLIYANIKREKENWAAAEKVKRDQWMAKESKAILERTRKALEPEGYFLKTFYIYSSSTSYRCQ